MGITIYDIAERAGVSTATVSRVFNNYPRVSASTRQRVMDIAKELGYQPHASAQSLARRRTNIISAVIPMMTNYFYVEVLRGLQDYLVDTEYDLLVYSARTPEEADGQLRAALHPGRSAGVLLFSTPINVERATAIRRSGQNVVLVDSSHPDFDAISIDNHQGAYLGTQHLLEQGAERVGLIMADPSSVPAVDRRRGYEQALREAGHAVDDALVAVSGRRDHHGYTEAAGHAAMCELLGRAARPDAVCVTSDIQALGALRALREAHINVPGEVSLVGFDDIIISRYVGLTTLRQPMYEMGQLAVEKLLYRIEHPEHPHTHTVFAPRLIVRQTTHAAADPIGGWADVMSEGRP